MPRRIVQITGGRRYVVPTGPAALRRRTTDCGATERGTGCGGSRCTSSVCRSWLACRRARGWLRALARLDRATGRRVPSLWVTLTIPAELRLRAARSETLRDLRRAAWEALCGWLAEQAGAGTNARWIGRVVIHPADERDRWCPHIEGFIAGTAERDDGRHVPIRIPRRLDYDDLRRRWEGALAEVHGPSGGAAPQIRVELPRSRRAVGRYAMRGWPGWIAAVTRIQAFGRRIAILDQGAVERLGEDEIEDEIEDKIEDKIEDRSDPPSPKIKNVFMPTEAKEKKSMDQILDSEIGTLRKLLHRHDEALRYHAIGQHASLLHRSGGWRLLAKTWDQFCTEQLGVARATVTNGRRLARLFSEADLRGLQVAEALALARAPARDRDRLLAVVRSGKLRGAELETEVSRLRAAAGCRPGPRARKGDDGEGDNAREEDHGTESTS